MDGERNSGSLIGAILLISGCCIGAGMLGLPVLSSLAGFAPSLGMFLLSWLFMVATALLLLEVNLSFSNEVSLITMAGKRLGFVGKIVCWVCFVFLFYALGVAYLSAVGELISSFFYDFFKVTIPQGFGSLAVCVLFGFCIYLGTRKVDQFNRILMSGLIVSYLFLIILGLPHVRKDFLSFHNWERAPFLLPIMIICFGFHNLIPSISAYLNKDVGRLRMAIIWGSIIPLIIYLIWQGLLLGLIPVTYQDFGQVLDQGKMATEILKDNIGLPWIIAVAEYFALFAILTSFLGNSLSFVDFLADGLSITKNAKGKLFLCILVILPSLTLSLLYPKIFLLALNYAGTFGAVILFGIIPILMAWSGRYFQKSHTQMILPGGKLSLIVALLFAVGVILLQLK